MDIIIKDSKNPKKEIQVGDVIYSSKYNRFYIFADEEKGFIARDLKTWQGLNGYHETLKKLLVSIEYEDNITYYSQNEYYLELVKK